MASIFTKLGRAMGLVPKVARLEQVKPAGLDFFQIFILVLGDAVESATGPAQKILKLQLRGMDDPFLTKPIKKGPGTKEQPTLIPSILDRRMLGCLCEEDQPGFTWIWLYKDQPKRCECGHWYLLKQVKSPLETVD